MKARFGSVFGEFVIVVIGVLTALAADSAMDRYREQQSAVEAFRALRNDVAEDLTSLDEFWMPRIQRQMDSRIRLGAFLGNGEPISDSVQFVRDVRLVSTYFTHDPNTAAIEYLKSTGGLRLIEDKALRGAILRYFNNIENIEEFDVIHRTAFLEWSGSIGPKLVGGLTLTYGFLSDSEAGEERDRTRTRAAASKALDAAQIRSSGLLRELLVATGQPFLLKMGRYGDLRDEAEELLVLLDGALENAN